jgi:hypothetical protein
MDLCRRGGSRCPFWPASHYAIANARRIPACCRNSRTTREVEEIRTDRAEEGRRIVSEPIVQESAHPGARCHAGAAEHQERRHPPACLADREERPQGQHISRHQAAKAKPEECRYGEQPDLILGHRERRERGRLARRANRKRRQSSDPRAARRSLSRQRTLR